MPPVGAPQDRTPFPALPSAGSERIPDWRRRGLARQSKARCRGASLERARWTITATPLDTLSRRAAKCS